MLTVVKMDIIKEVSCLTRESNPAKGRLFVKTQNELVILQFSKIEQEEGQEVGVQAVFYIKNV